MPDAGTPHSAAQARAGRNTAQAPIGIGYGRRKFEPDDLSWSVVNRN